ncbi:MAG: YHS domain-containing protein [Fervidicoccaceae archaeon]
MSEAIDPVCGMRVDKSKAKFKVIYKGKIYYFSSDHCRKAFEKEPDFYIEHGPTGMPS